MENIKLEDISALPTWLLTDLVYKYSPNSRPGKIQANRSDELLAKKLYSYLNGLTLNDMQKRQLYRDLLYEITYKKTTPPSPKVKETRTISKSAIYSITSDQLRALVSQYSTDNRVNNIVSLMDKKDLVDYLHGYINNRVGKSTEAKRNRLTSELINRMSEETIEKLAEEAGVAETKPRPRQQRSVFLSRNDLNYFRTSTLRTMLKNTGYDTNVAPVLNRSDTIRMLMYASDNRPFEQSLTNEFVMSLDVVEAETVAINIKAVNDLVRSEQLSLSELRNLIMSKGRVTPTAYTTPRRLRGIPETIDYDSCERFRERRDVNPLTGRRISPNGPTATALRETCNDRHSMGMISSPGGGREAACRDFKRRPNVNPLTGRYIEKGKRTHKRLTKWCN